MTNSIILFLLLTFLASSVRGQSGDVLWDMEFINQIAGEGGVKNCINDAGGARAPDG